MEGFHESILAPRTARAKKSLTNDWFPSALEQVLSWFVKRHYKACLKNASSRMSDAGVLTVRLAAHVSNGSITPDPKGIGAC